MGPREEICGREGGEGGRGGSGKLELFDSTRGSRRVRVAPAGALLEGPCGLHQRPQDRGAALARPPALALYTRSPPCARAQRVERLPRLVLSSVTMLPPQLYWLPLLAALLPPVPAQKFSALTVSPVPHPCLPHSLGTYTLL